MKGRGGGVVVADLVPAVFQLARAGTEQLVRSGLGTSLCRHTWCCSQQQGVIEATAPSRLQHCSILISEPRCHLCRRPKLRKLRRSRRTFKKTHAVASVFWLMAAWSCTQSQSSALQYQLAVGLQRQNARAVTRRENSPLPHKLPGARTPCWLEGHGLGRQAIWARPKAFSSQQQGETEQYGDGYEEEEEEEDDEEEETTVEAGGKVNTLACA